MLYVGVIDIFLCRMSLLNGGSNRLINCGAIPHVEFLGYFWFKVISINLICNLQFMSCSKFFPFCKICLENILLVMVMVFIRKFLGLKLTSISKPKMCVFLNFIFLFSNIGLEDFYLKFFLKF